jgi:Sec1 family
LAPDEDSQFAATRYIPVMKSILTAMCHDELSFESYPSVLPMPTPSSSPAGRSSSGAARNSSTINSARKSTSGAASSVRKTVGASSKWGANAGSSLSASHTGGAGPVAFTGARGVVFMVGGLCYPELRVAREVMEQTGREIILGSTSFLSANEFMDDLGKLSR